jgi:hypothetical protein
MKKCFCLVALVFIASGVHAQNFEIAPAAGYSEPLSQNDVIEITESYVNLTLHTFVAALWVMYYDDIQMGEVAIPDGYFQIDEFGDLTGSAPLDVGDFHAANKVELYIQTVQYPGIHHWYSINKLDVEATQPMVPATGPSGIILLLAGITLYIVLKK